MSEAEGADGLVVQGYIPCRCGEWMIDPGPTSSIRLCADCRAALKDKADQGRLRYEVEGRTFTTPPPQKRRPQKRRPRSGRLTTEQRDRRRRTDRAKIRAYVRLARIYRPMFELLYAEEKLREGLDPTIHSAIPRPRAIEAELLRDLAEAEERDLATGARLRAGG